MWQSVLFVAIGDLCGSWYSFFVAVGIHQDAENALRSQLVGDVSRRELSTSDGIMDTMVAELCKGSFNTWGSISTYILEKQKLPANAQDSNIPRFAVVLIPAHDPIATVATAADECTRTAALTSGE